MTYIQLFSELTLHICIEATHDLHKMCLNCLKSEFVLIANITDSELVLIANLSE